MGKASAPSTPDPIATSQAQAGANIDTARIQQKLNLVDQYTPYGNITYTPAAQFYGGAPQQAGGGSAATPSAPKTMSYEDTVRYNAATHGLNDPKNRATNQGILDEISGRYGSSAAPTNSPSGSSKYTTPYDFSNPYSDRYVSQVTLPEDSQAAVANQQKYEKLISQLGVDQTGRVSDALSKAFTLDGLPAAPTADAAARSAYQKQVLDFYDSRNNPENDRLREQARVRLINQGIPENSEAWTNTMQGLERNIGDSRLAAETSALQNGGAEMERGYNLGKDARSTALQELLLQRQLPLNEASALISGSQVQLPQFQATPQTSVNAPNVEGNINSAYQQQVAAANAKNSATSGLFGGLASLGLSAINPAAGWFGAASGKIPVK